MAMNEEMRKHLILHNTIGLVNGGIDLKEALDMAWDLNEPLFSERLKMKRKDGSGQGAPGGGGGSTSGPGGSFGGATGG